MANHGIHTRLTLRHDLNCRCLSLVHANAKCFMLVDVTMTQTFWTTGGASSWHGQRRVYCTCECASHLWYHNCSCGKRAVEISHGVVQKLLTSWKSAVFIPILVDRSSVSKRSSYGVSTLIMTTTWTHCVWQRYGHTACGNDMDTTTWTHCLRMDCLYTKSVDSRSMLQVWGCAERPQQSVQSTG